MSYPALVEPAAELTIDEVRRYSRHLIIPDVGMAGQKRLKNAKVLVIGAGGLGSPALLYLAAAGVGTLGVVDFDEVDESNLQRQVIHGQSDIGRSKAASARDSVAEVNPLVEMVVHEEQLTNENVFDVFGGYDLILDGTDNFATRYMVNDAAYFLGIPYVWGSIFRFEGQVSVFAPTLRQQDETQSPTSDSGLQHQTSDSGLQHKTSASGLQHQTSDSGLQHKTSDSGLQHKTSASGLPCYRCLYPEPPPPGMVPSCAEGGVLGVLCATIGSIQVNEAIKLLTGLGDPLAGRLMTYDALEMEFHTLTVRRDPDCALCGNNATVTELIDYEAFCGAVSDDAAEAAAGSTISVTQLESMLAERDRGDRDFTLIDVREPGEAEINHIPGSVLVPKGEFENGSAIGRLDELTKGGSTPVVLHCKSGQRSAECLSIVQGAGYADATHVGGGVAAWVDQIDPSQPAY